MVSSVPWTVPLMGGSPGVGKTVVARQIGRRLGLPWLQADDLRLALTYSSTPEQQPALHALAAAATDPVASAEAVCARLIETGRIVSHALEIVVANHLATAAPLVIEGDGILPVMAAQRRFAERNALNQVRAAFVFEPDEAALFENALARGRGFDALTAAARQQAVRRSWLYGRWLHDEALRYGLPVIDAWPWPTLAERLLAAL
jgi:2-phosphoglycerate kinase